MNRNKAAESRKEKLIFLTGSLVLVLAIFNSLLTRISGIPFGIVLDATLLLSLGLCLSTASSRPLYNHPVVIIILIWMVFCMLNVLFVSPNSLSALFPYRNYAFRLLAVVPFIHMLKSARSLPKTIMLITCINIIICLYGIMQRFVHYPDWDIRYIYNSPERLELFTHFDLLRIISVFSDPTTLGIYCMVMLLFSLLLLKNISSRRLMMLVLFSLPLLLATCLLAYSRTPFVLAVIAAGFYFIYTFNIRTVLITACASLIILIPILLTDNAMGERIKSAFHLENNVSLQIRNADRHYVQELVFEKPFGIGIALVSIGLGLLLFM